MNRGQLTILTIFGLSLAAAVASLTWRYLQTQKVLTFWGPQAATMIASPDRVEAWRLQPRQAGTAPKDGETDILVGDRPYVVVTKIDITRAPGFTHARHELTMQSGFDWDRDAACDPTWSHALVFCRGDQCATVALDLECSLVRVLSDNSQGDQQAFIKKYIARGLKIVLDEQFGIPQTPPDPTNQAK